MNSKITLFLLENVLIVFCKMTVSIMYLCENYDRVSHSELQSSKEYQNKELEYTESNGYNFRSYVVTSFFFKIHPQ